MAPYPPGARRHRHVFRHWTVEEWARRSELERALRRNPEDAYVARELARLRQIAERRASATYPAAVA